MKTIKIIMAIMAMVAATAANAQGYEAMFKQALEYKGTEWSVIPLDEGYEEKIYFLWSDNKKGDISAKIIVPEFEGENSTMLLLTNADCENIAKLTIKVGDVVYPLRKISKGQAKDEDTYLSSYTVFPKNRNIFAELFCHGVDSGTMFTINTKFPAMLDVKNNLTIEVPFAEGSFTFTFSPTKAVK